MPISEDVSMPSSGSDEQNLARYAKAYADARNCASSYEEGVVVRQMLSRAMESGLSPADIRAYAEQHGMTFGRLGDRDLTLGEKGREVLSIARSRLRELLGGFPSWGDEHQEVRKRTEKRRFNRKHPVSN